MKHLILKSLAIVMVAASIQGCSNKKQENNIKSLEKRIAELERNNSGTKQDGVVEAQQEENNFAEYSSMTFKETEYDFGTVNEGEIVNYTYKFTNTGSSMLIISKATATCGCTVPEWPKEPIKPGKTGEIKVIFDSKGMKNLQTKYVTINANTKPEVTRLKLTGNVIAKEDLNN